MSDMTYEEMKAEIKRLDQEKADAVQAKRDEERRLREEADNKWALDRLPTTPGMYIVVRPELPTNMYSLHWLDEDGSWYGDDPRYDSGAKDFPEEPRHVVDGGWPIKGGLPYQRCGIRREGLGRL